MFFGNPEPLEANAAALVEHIAVHAVKARNLRLEKQVCVIWFSQD